MLMQKTYEAAVSILKDLKEIDSQYDLNGTRNVWIVKPSLLCCGSGISISHNLKDILRRAETKPKDYFIVQKYIGNCYQFEYEFRKYKFYIFENADSIYFNIYRASTVGSRN